MYEKSIEQRVKDIIVEQLGVKISTFKATVEELAKTRAIDR